MSALLAYVGSYSSPSGSFFLKDDPGARRRRIVVELDPGQLQAFLEPFGRNRSWGFPRTPHDGLMESGKAASAVQLEETKPARESAMGLGGARPSGSTAGRSALPGKRFQSSLELSKTKRKVSRDAMEPIEGRSSRTSRRSRMRAAPVPEGDGALQGTRPETGASGGERDSVKTGESRGSESSPEPLSLQPRKAALQEEEKRRLGVLEENRREQARKIIKRSTDWKAPSGDEREESAGEGGRNQNRAKPASPSEPDAESPPAGPGRPEPGEPEKKGRGDSEKQPQSIQVKLKSDRSPGRPGNGSFSYRGNSGAESVEKLRELLERADPSKKIRVEILVDLESP
jgi:hypothetical protein